MKLGEKSTNYDLMKQKYPKKFVSKENIFRKIHRGDRIFLHTGCGEPQYLVRSLIKYIESRPKAFFDAEVFQSINIFTLGVAPYATTKFQRNFRMNAFFVGDPTREGVNTGLSDYTPIFLSNVPDLFYRGLVPIDVALIQVSPPDDHGYLNLGVSVDIVKAAVEKASLIIAQMNIHMPRIHGDGFIHINDVDYIVPYDEPILEFDPDLTIDNLHKEISFRIGNYVSRLIQEGDTIQVGYGSIPNAIMANLTEKKNLGIHTELVSDGLVDLMKQGIVDNTKKTLNRHKTIGSFSMGTRKTYEYIHDNPFIELKRIDYTNNPLTIAQHDNMTAINSALQVDLTGQASAESIGIQFYSGIGGQADFMRGAALARNGKTILALPSTAEDGAISRIVPFLKEGAGATLNRGDIQYVVTEYGIAYLHGKNIRERVMQLISIAHPDFRPSLLIEAKKFNLIYKDQAFIQGIKGEYPEHLEIYRTTSSELEIFLRPVKITDEPLLKDIFYDLSDRSLYRRFLSTRTDMPHARLQDFCVIDYTKEMVILAIVKEEGIDLVVGIGQYGTYGRSHYAEVAMVVRDKWQKKGIGSELLRYLTYLAKTQGLMGFTGLVLSENRSMLHILEKTFPKTLHKRYTDNEFELTMDFDSS
ncbi:MAG: GNAT family N-acetyltransferase [Candidatus Hodarchaeales archaeon]|jgi:acyl-CoA hydrolase